MSVDDRARIFALSGFADAAEFEARRPSWEPDTTYPDEQSAVEAARLWIDQRGRADSSVDVIDLSTEPARVVAIVTSTGCERIGWSGPAPRPRSAWREATRRWIERSPAHRVLVGVGFMAVSIAFLLWPHTFVIAGTSAVSVEVAGALGLLACGAAAVGVLRRGVRRRRRP